MARGAKVTNAELLSKQTQSKVKPIDPELELQEKVLEARSNPDIILTIPQLEVLCSQLTSEDIFAFDTETTGVDFQTLALVGISLYLPTIQRAVYIPVGHTGPDTRHFNQLTISQVIRELKPFFLDEGKVLVAHNHKFDLQVMRNYGVDYGFKHRTKGIIDTMILSFLIDENRKSHSLKYLEDYLLHMTVVDLDKAKKKRISDVYVSDAGYYARSDAKLCYLVWEKDGPKLASEKLEGVFWRKEMPMVVTLCNMERRGIDFDLDHLAEMEQKVAKETIEQQRAIYKAVGFEFNLDSSKQLGQVLFEEMKLPVVERTDKGAYKTDKDVLDTLAKKYPFAKSIKRYRELQKVNGTYIIGLRDRIGKDGRIHGSFNQHVTVTGRLSSSDPNL
jgi:DNA polymerase-1